MGWIYRNDRGCQLADCHCHVLADAIRVSTGPLANCACGCTWSAIEPLGAGRDQFGRPDPGAHPEAWTE